jgi:hypothetical protein
VVAARTDTTAVAEWQVTARDSAPPSSGRRTRYFAGVTWTYQPPNVGSIVMLRPFGPA